VLIKQYTSSAGGFYWFLVGSLESRRSIYNSISRHSASVASGG